MEPRVTPNLASFSATGDESAGRPAASLFQLRLPMSPRVAPAAASSGCAGNASSSCPESRVLRRFRRLSLGLPLGFALQLRLPVHLRVAPLSAPSGFASGFKSPGRPESSLLRLRLMVLRVTSDPAPSGSAALASSGCPESCTCGWVDDDSRFSSNFASSAKLRMNLRVQSGFAHSRLTLDAFSQFQSGLSTAGQADYELSEFHCILHRPVSLELRFQFPARSSTTKTPETEVSGASIG
jgi:hypothetical protein